MSANQLFTRAATATARFAGRPVTFLGCCAIVVVWAVCGPVFNYSDTWQLIINTGTTIVTFLMVFLIQNTQNRDSAALHAKLDELIRVGTAKNSFIGIEHLTDQELDEILKTCESEAGRRDAENERHAIFTGQENAPEKAAPPKRTRTATQRAKPAAKPRSRAKSAA